MDSAGKRVILVVALMVVVFLGALSARHSMHSDYTSSYELPLMIGSWKGEDANTNLDSLRSELGAQSIVFRTYSIGNTAVTLYLAYYKDVDSANRVHAPTVCYPGQGWTVKADEIVSLDVPARKIKVNPLVIEKEKERELVYNWWRTGDAVLPRNSMNRFYQMLKSVLGKNPSTIWVRLSIRATGDPGADEKELARFAQDITPFLGNYFRR